MAAVAPSSLLPQLLADTAVQDPDRVVIHDLSLGERITAAGLHHQAMQWAGTLRSAGVGPGDTVLSMLPSGATPIAVWTGVAWLLAITVTVNEEYRGRLLADVLADSRARVMVVHGEYLDQVLEVLGEIGVERLIVVDDPRSAPRDTESVGGVVIEPVAAFLGEPAAEGELTAPRAHDISAIVYTSGTTGPSKGVMISWQQMHATAVWCLPFGELGPGDRAYLPYPAYHMSFLAQVLGMVLCGGGVVLRRRFSPSAFWTDVRDNGCTYGSMVGSMATLLMAQPRRDDDADNPLRLVGMVPVAEDVEKFQERFGVRVGTLYNLSEGSVLTVSPDWQVRKVGNAYSCGRARPGVELRIVDENDWPVPDGQVGELVVRTDDPWLLTPGYWGRPEATAKAWRNGWFHTGDALRRNADGDYFYVDRISDSLRRRGENISSAEVEALVAAHPQVREAAAIAVPSDLGEDDVAVIVVTEPGAELSPAELDAYLADTMPRFMRPRYIEFVPELPKTPTQKVRKAVLRERGLGAGAWDRESPSGSAARSAGDDARGTPCRSQD